MQEQLARLALAQRDTTIHELERQLSIRAGLRARRVRVTGARRRAGRTG